MKPYKWVLEAALYISGLGKRPKQPCYLEGAVHCTKWCNNENYLSISNCVAKFWAGPGKRAIIQSRALTPGWRESTVKLVFTWSKRFHAMVVLMHTWSASEKTTKRRVATTAPLWIMRSIHFSSAAGGVEIFLWIETAWIAASFSKLQFHVVTSLIDYFYIPY